MDSPPRFTVVRPGPIADVIPGDTRLVSVSFEGVGVERVCIDQPGVPAADSTFFVSPNTDQVDLTTPVLLRSVQGIQIARDQGTQASGSMVLQYEAEGLQSTAVVPLALADGTSMQQVAYLSGDTADRRAELLAHLQANRAYYTQAIFEPPRLCIPDHVALGHLMEREAAHRADRTSPARHRRQLPCPSRTRRRHRHRRHRRHPDMGRPPEGTQHHVRPARRSPRPDPHRRRLRRSSARSIQLGRGTRHHPLLELARLSDPTCAARDRPSKYRLQSHRRDVDAGTTRSPRTQSHEPDGAAGSDGTICGFGSACERQHVPRHERPGRHSGTGSSSERRDTHCSDGGGANRERQLQGRDEPGNRDGQSRRRHVENDEEHRRKRLREAEQGRNLRRWRTNQPGQEPRPKRALNRLNLRQPKFNLRRPELRRNRRKPTDARVRSL